MRRYLDALRGLREPRRLAALAAVLVALVATEALATRALLPVALDALLFAVFVVAAPGGHRVLAPRGALGLAAYAALGVACVGLVALVVARVSPRWTYVIDPGSLAVLVVLFLVGGWGLGRDVDLSERNATLEVEARRAQLEAERAQLAAQQAQLQAQQAQLEAQQAQLQAQQAQLQAQQAQLATQRASLVAEQNALLAQRAQLDPHFLFNVLNAIAEHCRHDPEIAERSLLSLARLLRTMLDATRAPSWPLRTELELVRAVTELYAVRDRSRYRFRLSWPALDDVALPPLLLLPVIENAITHGPGADHDGEVSLEVTKEDQHVEIRVENPGPFEGPREGGEGLAMIRKRLALAFGEAARFSIHAITDDARGPRTRATLRFPITGPTEAA